MSLYQTGTFLAVLIGQIVLGTAFLLLLQGFASIPQGIQYLLLTALIAAAFITSPLFAVTPAEARLAGRAFVIRPKRGGEQIIVEGDVLSYAYYQELILFSLKINLRNGETISVIRFKWGDSSDFQAFFEALETLIGGGAAAPGTGRRSATFYGSRAKRIVTFVLLAFFLAAAAALLLSGGFRMWNPVGIYYFWVLPAAFFLKMWKGK
ncbi:MAG: hypothetical protein JW929_16685 [Anaerolineales bacterium]|nr:hypothetical protein [Anaerolineales bacterium]